MNPSEARGIFETNYGDFLPDEAYFKRQFGEDMGKNVISALQTHLLNPALSMVIRPCKAIRAKLVYAGYFLADEAADSIENETDKNNLTVCANAIEFLHAGSLIVDDIQDHSSIRRGEPALHHLYGESASIATGNWLYFWPLRLMQDKLVLNDKCRMQVYDFYHRALEQAHYGQSLDVSLPMTKITQNEVATLCDWVKEQKSGVLTALSLQLGAVCAGGSGAALEFAFHFGKKFGAALQNFDDIGNVKGQREKAKQWEDLINRRPSWLWSCAARYFNATDYGKFLAAVERFPDSAPFSEWMNRSGLLAFAESQALSDLDAVYALLEVLPGLSNQAQVLFREMGEQIKNAYT